MKTTSYETSKKLKELGMQQFPFEYAYDNEGNLHYKEYIGYLTGKMSASHTRAYILDEILEMLPYEVITKTEFNTFDWRLQIDKYRNNYIIKYQGILSYNSNAIVVKKSSENPAEAAGQFLVWCIENGYVEPEELNQKEK
jgi:hypothetical protein